MDDGSVVPYVIERFGKSLSIIDYSVSNYFNYSNPIPCMHVFSYVYVSTGELVSLTNKYHRGEADRKNQAGTTGSFNKQEHRVREPMHWSCAIKDWLSSHATTPGFDIQSFYSFCLAFILFRSNHLYVLWYACTT
jgi:hypothetical protein